MTHTSTTETAVRARARFPAPVSTSSSVLAGHPILLVLHDLDRGWRVLDTPTDQVPAGPDTTWARLLELDPGLDQLAELGPGWVAHRDSRTRPWQRSPR